MMAVLFLVLLHAAGNARLSLQRFPIGIHACPVSNALITVAEFVHTWNF